MGETANLQLSPEAMQTIAKEVVAAMRQYPRPPRKTWSIGAAVGVAGLVLTAALAVGGGWLNHSNQLAAQQTRVMQLEVSVSELKTQVQQEQNYQANIQSVGAQVSALQNTVEQLRTDIRDLQKAQMNTKH